MPRRHRAEQSRQLPHLGPDIVRANGLVLEPSGHARHRLGRPSIFPIIPNTEAFFSGWTYLNGRASCVLKVKATRIILAHTVNGASLERKLFLPIGLEMCRGFEPCNISEECRKLESSAAHRRAAFHLSSFLQKPHVCAFSWEHSHNQEYPMKEMRSCTLSAAVLVAAVSTASAGSVETGSVSARTPGAATDRLDLNRIQQKVAWADLSSLPTRRKAPSGSIPTQGSVLPNSVVIQAVTKKAAGDVPVLKSYDFAIVSGKLLIVNPSDKKVAEVIRKGSFFA